MLVGCILGSTFVAVGIVVGVLVTMILLKKGTSINFQDHNIICFFLLCVCTLGFISFQKLRRR